MDKRVKNFYKRWNIKYDENKEFEELKQRVLHSFDICLGEILLNNSILEEKLIKFMGINPPQAYSTKTVSGLFGNLTLSSFQGYSIPFNETRIYSLISKINDFIGLIKCVQAVFWLDLNSEIKEKFVLDIEENFKLGGIHANIKKSGNSFVIYPTGAKILDEKLVNDVLNWLDKYPNSKKQFVQALEDYNNKGSSRAVVDNMRLSLELLLRAVLKNKKSLENQLNLIGKNMKDNGTPTEIGNMLPTLLTYYTKYQNEFAKHSAKVNEKEIEFVIYLTGSFMRYIISIQESK